jgi:hypothetical protein
LGDVYLNRHTSAIFLKEMLPALALGLEKPLKEAIARPPRSRDERAFPGGCQGDGVVDTPNSQGYWVCGVELY